MTRHPLLFSQASPANPAQPAPPGQATQAAPVAPTREQIRTQIRQTIQDATRAAAEASGDNAVTIIDGRPVIAGGPANGQGITIHRSGMDDVIPPQAVDISIAFFIMIAVIIIGWPLARAFGRRLERRADTPALPDPAISGQLQRIEQAVEAMSIEIERISESQRFMAKLQNGAADRAALGTIERR
jgi:hypothetical protein